MVFETFLEIERVGARDHARPCMGATALISVALSGPGSMPAAAQPQQRPNIVVIMGDDIGICIRPTTAA